jgi:AcrR family transcriptional regulator
VAETRQLPRGRHGLSREEVETDQRLRIFIGMAAAMGEAGYVGTPVAEIIRRAGVSRETFYQLYDDKLDAFLAAFDLVGEVLLGRLAESLDGTDDRLARVERAITAYLDTLASEPGYARLFLVEVHAAGPEAMDRRTAIQQRIVDALADLLEARTEAERFTCQVVVAAVGAMVAGPLVTGDSAALRALGPPLVGHLRRLEAAGLFPPTRAARPAKGAGR